LDGLEVTSQDLVDGLLDEFIDRGHFDLDGLGGFNKRICFDGFLFREFSRFSASAGLGGGLGGVGVVGGGVVVVVMAASVSVRLFLVRARVLLIVRFVAGLLVINGNLPVLVAVLASVGMLGLVPGLFVFVDVFLPGLFVFVLVLVFVPGLFVFVAVFVPGLFVFVLVFVFVVVVVFVVFPVVVGVPNVVGFVS